jgi:hypothetical protein
MTKYIVVNEETYTVWNQEYFLVDADTPEEAEEKVSNEAKGVIHIKSEQVEDDFLGLENIDVHVATETELSTLKEQFKKQFKEQENESI